MNKPRTAIVVLLIIVAALWILTPAKLQPEIEALVLPDDLGSWLRQSEQQASERYGLVPGTEKRITWAGDAVQTPYSVLYLHGFSATRQETAPLAEIVAARLGANLYETRLTGHGREREPLTDVRAEDWLQDAVEALTIAARLGERVIVIGTSTGATLAAAMLGHPVMDSVDTLVMISPNFAPRDTNALWLTRPAGPLIAKMLVGDTRSWEPHNERQGLYWSTSYPTTSAIEMMRLVGLANRHMPADIQQRLLMLYSSRDTVIAPAAALSVFEQTGAPQKAAIEIDDVGDPSNHVLAGDILSGGTTQEIADHIVDFILRPAP